MKCFVYFIAIIGISLAADSTVPSDVSKKTTLPVTTESTTTTSTTTTKPTSTNPTTTTTASTTLAPTTTVKPNPIPTPQVGNWTWTDPTSNNTCVIIQMAAQLNVTYLDKGNNTVYTLINIPTNASTIAGSCVGLKQYIGLAWPSKNLNKSNSLTLTFFENNSTKFYTLSNITIDLIGEDLPDYILDSLDLKYNGSDIYAPVSKSYHCTRQQKFNMTEAQSDKFLSTIEFSHFQVEAFHKDASKTFSEARDCDAVDTPDVVPIAVGCALAALVIIVLVAYLVARRNSPRGYLSM